MKESDSQIGLREAMTRYDEGPTLGWQFLAGMACLAAFWIGMVFAEWAGSAFGSLLITVILAGALPVAMHMIPPKFGFDYADSENARTGQATTIFERVWLIAKWLLVFAAVVYLASNFIEKVGREGLDYWDAAWVGFLVGSVVLALILHLRSRRGSGRQFTP